MRRRSILLAICSAASIWAADVNPDEVIRKFAAKESEFLTAREQYT